MDFDTLSSKYLGRVANEYEEKRLDYKWLAEQQAIEQLVQSIPKGSKVLDAPVGTGRLIPVLDRRGLDHVGLDVSADMLAQARECAERTGAKVSLQQGDIRHMNFPDGHFDAAVCLRFLNWVDSQGVADVLKELARVSRDRLLIGVRYLTPESELRMHGIDLVLRGSRLLRLPHIHARRHGMIVHRKSDLESLFEKLRLSVLEECMIERRWDGTDYVFYVLGKRQQRAAA